MDKSDIKVALLDHIKKQGRASWENAVLAVAAKHDVNRSYVEQAMGELVRAGAIQQNKKAWSSPEYFAMSRFERELDKEGSMPTGKRPLDFLDDPEEKEQREARQHELDDTWQVAEGAGDHHWGITQ